MPQLPNHILLNWNNYKQNLILKNGKSEQNVLKNQIQLLILQINQRFQSCEFPTILYEEFTTLKIQYDSLITKQKDETNSLMTEYKLKIQEPNE